MTAPATAWSGRRVRDDVADLRDDHGGLPRDGRDPGLRPLGHRAGARPDRARPRRDRRRPRGRAGRGLLHAAPRRPHRPSGRSAGAGMAAGSSRPPSTLVRRRGHDALQLYVPPHLPGSVAFAEALGFRYRSSLWQFQLPADHPVPAPAFPADVTTRHFDPAIDTDVDAWVAFMLATFEGHPTPDDLDAVGHRPRQRVARFRPERDPAGHPGRRAERTRGVRQDRDPHRGDRRDDRRRRADRRPAGLARARSRPRAAPLGRRRICGAAAPTGSSSRSRRPTTARPACTAPTASSPTSSGRTGCCRSTDSGTPGAASASR